ncbi:MAG: hypothetical protein M9899_09135 [Bdellovibrionaceae bacterium]|nr:hypothetical protein [Pseudobdellovibrionaceae bacterium]
MHKKNRRTLQQIIKPYEIAHEAYAVFMQRQRAARTVPKAFLEARLKDHDVYTEFLKLSMEHDFSKDLAIFRKALAVVVKVIGPSKVAKATGINRVTLYRMLAKDGNPGIRNLMALLHALNLNLWVVDKEFYEHRERVRRRTGHFS